ncbi:DExH-box ATP-dependent RNA helicase DExH17-like isoform X1 [Hevea brasiliensis]|uniref:DExH-box ATP-dependent RNA helicase DExH17-like isoform X1 n=1 Tax=Hevea brasiliensis TaxID=3981 RepID=UPI0025EB7B7A|nr:DExH-box ATP-dependent RNA helicase DExH17-like isoform X1 [Hevea brasiliensis]
MDSYSLKSVSDLPAPFRSIFNFRYFNSLQSECFPVCYHSNVNMVISAPTGSGKTVLFELCILRLLSRFISEGRFIHIKGTLKTIYIAPSKALVQEKLRDWNQKFGSLGINCLELTGDNEFYSIRTVQEADIILTTPEKFDAVTRYRLKDGGLSFFSDIALLLIDEVHLLNDPRGAALEAIVSRIKMLAHNPEMKSSTLSCVRFLAVSATIPNIEDIAEWLSVPAQGIKRFGEEMRPVKLTTKVFGYTPAKNDFLFEKRLQNYIFDILMQYSRGKSALVFCSTRKGAQEAAQRLSQTAMTFGYSNPFIKDKEQQERLREASLSCSDKQMQSYILYGVGYHNGGLCLKDRNLVEGLFLKGDIQILCTTNTLAHGINLPAHTVVIKSTQHFNKEKGLYMEYDRSTILQMCGRAGRPPFDDTGMVIIMTRRETVHLYENLLNGCEMVESQLLSCVTEHLTAEIVQLTVSDIARAIEWMKCSYLYVRMKKNPEKYAVRKVISRDRIEKHVQEISVQKVNELSRHQMIWTGEDGFLLKPLEPGRLMTKYYLKFDTMKHIMQTTDNCSLEDALNVICCAEEIAWIQLRRSEKKLLNDINIDKDGRLRFHVNGDKGKRKKRIQTREEKIFVLANDCLTGDPSVHDLSLTQDMNSVCSNGCRIAKCMKEFFIFKKNYKGAVNSTLLAKSLYQKLWDDSPYLLKQLPGIGMVTAKALHSMGIKSFDELAEADPRRIEIVTGRKFPFGNHIKDSLLSLPPKVSISIEETVCRRQGKSKLVVTFTRLSQSIQSGKRHYADMIIGTEEDNLIHFHEKISRVDEFTSPYSTTVLLSTPKESKLSVKADLIFEEYIGLDFHEKLILLKDNNSGMNYTCGQKQPSLFPPPVEICLIEDDNETISYASAERLCNLKKSKTEDSSMPSFKLIDAELEEGKHPVEIKKDNQKVITKQAIFDHIREKAKNFPILTPAKSSSSPLSEALLFTRKHPYKKDIDLDTELIVIEEIEGSKIPQQIVTNPSSEIREMEQNGYNINNHLAPKQGTPSRSSGTMNFLDYKGGRPSESEKSILKSLTEETIFGHIRERANNFPVLSRTMQSESPMWTKEQSTENQPEFCIAASDALSEMFSDDKIMRETVIISDLEPGGTVMNDCDSSAGAKVKENKFPRSPCLTYESLSISPRISRINNDPSCMEILPFDISMIKDNTRSLDSASSMEHKRKQLKHCSPNGSKRQCWSMAMAGKTKEVDSFHGFESVFSFL